MKISLEWLREYVKVEAAPAELVDKLNMIGLVVESVEEKDGDVVIEIETYANRPDTLGHLGVARELAAAYGLPLEAPAWPVIEVPEKAAGLVDVQVADESLCPRYCGMIVRGVRVGPSPDWLRRRIEAVGLRPINNVVDVTNYVLFATAQPIHAFDLSRIRGSKVIVRRAKRGESLRDLDGRLLELDPEMLVIADESRPIALAGVIGGEESGITEATSDVFIESANFDPVSIRRTSKKLGLSTDASYRFERGADVSFPPQAARMVASLLTRMGGKAASGLIDVYPRPYKPKTVILRRQRVADLLGVPVEAGFIAAVLERLGFSLSEQREGVWAVEPPSFRVDIEREADLIEEVARFYGYDRIPSEPTPLRSFELTVNRRRERLRKLREALLGQGFDEVINMSFSDPETEQALGGSSAPVPIRNPISVRASVMRTSLMPGLLENAAWNLNRGLEGVHIFEFGNVYYMKEDRPQEELCLGLLATGLLEGSGIWEKPRPTGLHILKGAVEAALERLRYEPIAFEREAHPYFEPDSSLTILYKGQPVGCLGRVRGGLAGRHSLEADVYAAELSLAALFEKQPRPFQYAPAPRFPAVVRDLSFLIDADVPYREVEKALARLKAPLLEAAELRDRFTGASVPAGAVSLTIRFRYRHPQRTLQAEEADQAEREVLSQLGAALKLQLREGKIDNRD